MQVESVGPTIRPAVATDAEPLRRFLTGLSTRSAYSRFFTGIGRLPDRMLAPLLHRGPAQEVLLAVHCGEVVAHGMCSALPGRDSVGELALVVADAWQRRGLGQLLARELLATAPECGFRQITFTVLADNRPAVRFVSGLWPNVRPLIGHGMYEYLVPVPLRIAA
jgi:GNAT superfamily N-acetyltransferase